MFWVYFWGGIAIVYCIWIIVITRKPNGNKNLRILSFIGGILLVLLLAIIANEIYNHSNPKSVIFAGKIVNDKTGEWSNNRLVLVYLKGKEIGRDTSKTSEFITDLGMLDGVFVVPITNTYKL